MPPDHEDLVVPKASRLEAFIFCCPGVFPRKERLLFDEDMQFSSIHSPDKWGRVCFSYLFSAATVFSRKYCSLYGGQERKEDIMNCKKLTAIFLAIALLSTTLVGLRQRRFRRYQFIRCAE